MKLSIVLLIHMSENKTNNNRCPHTRTTKSLIVCRNKKKNPNNLSKIQLYEMFRHLSNKKLLRNIIKSGELVG